MIKKKIIKNMFFFFTFFLFSTFNVYALGIGPAEIILNFEPNLDKNIDYVVVNSVSKEIYVEISSGGELGKYVQCDIKKIKLAPHEIKHFLCNIKLPSDIKLEPGLHQADIVAEEILSPEQKEGTTMGGRVVVISRMVVKVPYPEKYITINLLTKNIKAREIAEFEIILISHSKENVTAEGSLFIYFNNTLIKTLKIEKTFVEALSTKKVKVSFDTTDFTAGLYKAIVNISYDGKIAQAKSEFRIGELIVNILDITPTKVVKGDVAKIEIEIESFWNEKIDNVYAEAHILKDNSVIGIAKSSPVSLEPWQKTKLQAYGETDNIPIGIYDLKAILYYAGKTTEYLKKNSLIISSKISLKIFFLLIIIFLLFVIYLLYKFLKKKFKK